MVRGDKNPLAEVSSPAASDEGEEIDRIMKEIEDLEKKMDAAPEETTSGESTQSAKVVSIRQSQNEESLAETDAVPARDEPLVRNRESLGASADGGLALKIGGCSDVTLEFSRAGMTVSLSCTDEGLCITTDQGAEFRIPIKRSA